tara:strand:- start:186 stop:1970 length:1785 start_codon:yes stop_codon:yes gene_type:complete
MNLSLQINKLLRNFESDNKFEIYKELEKIFKKNKDNNLLRYNLAVIQQKLNLNTEAKSNYKYLIKIEKNLKAMINLYNIYFFEESYYEALILIDNILNIQQIESIHKDKAFACLKLNNIKTCKEICYHYLSKNSKDIICLNILGQCYFAEAKHNEAIKVFTDILKTDPKNLSALNSLGRIYHEKRDAEKAEKFFLDALEINDLSYHVINNIAGFYREEGKSYEAIKYYKKAISLNPNNSFIYNNLSKTYFDLNNHKEALANSFKALKLNPDNGDIKKTLSFIYLKDHDYKNGWDYFEGRLSLDEYTKKNKKVEQLNKKLFRKKILNNSKKNFLVIREQGVGDEILYSSMYIDILKKFENITIECDPRLINLFKRSFTKYSNSFVELGTISDNKYKFDKIDYVVYAGSLGKYYRKNLNNFTGEPYLKVDEKKFIEIKNKLSSYKKKFNIGISWKSFKNRYSSDKSLTLNDFQNIFEMPDCNVFNLQYGDVLDEIKEFNNKRERLLSIKNLDLYNDFEGLAALLKALDLFVTVSNSTAHLAGSLGVKTILIKPNNYALFHYWNLKTNKTPWYNSIKLIERKGFLNDSKILKNYLTL